MTDKELLELAAKAAGIDYLPAETEKGKDCELKFGLWLNKQVEVPDSVRRRWQPLTDDGDALRLAVKLGLVISPNYWVEQPSLWVIEFTELDDGDDPYAATRRVIVRAAAEIGRNMK